MGELPQSGSASMEGQYKGIMVDRTTLPGAQFRRHYVTGQAILSADFEEGTVSGGIYQRRLVDISTFEHIASPVQTLIFQDTEVSPEGTFSQTLRPTSLPHKDSVLDTATGTIEGVLGNNPNNGPLVAGIVNIEHDYEGAGTQIEVGAFVTEDVSLTP